MVPSEYTTMDDEPVVGVRCDRVRDQRSLVKALEAQGTRTYEGDIPFGRQYLIGQSLRGGVRINGSWTPGDRVTGTTPIRRFNQRTGNPLSACWQWISKPIQKHPPYTPWVLSCQIPWRTSTRKRSTWSANPLQMIRIRILLAR